METDPILVMLLILIRESAKETLYCSIEAQCTRGRGTYVTIFDIAIFVFVIILIIIIHITIIIILSRLVVLSILVGEHMSQFSTLLFSGQKRTWVGSALWSHQRCRTFPYASRAIWMA